MVTSGGASRQTFAPRLALTEALALFVPTTKLLQDKSGSIDMNELVEALLTIQREFLAKYGKRGWKGSIDAQVEGLRARAAAGQMALSATAKAEAQQAELDELLKDIDGRLEVQVGLVFVSRRIKVGEVVGTWCKTKGNSAKRELSKAEFKDEVRTLSSTS